MRAHAQREYLDEECEKVGTRRTVKVDVVEPEPRERFVKLLLDVLGRMAVVPKRGRGEELLALDDRLDDTLECRADLILVFVDHRKVKVAIPMTNSVLDLVAK